MLERDRTVLVVVDLQEAFRPVILGFDAVAGAIAKLLRAARLLDLPAIVSEQHPRGLGPTAAELTELIVDARRIEKRVFSAARADAFDVGARDQVLLCGIETHICVWQTGHDLLRAGHEVHVVRGAVSARSAGDHETGMLRLTAAGATPTSVETALFELMLDADHPRFGDVQALVR
jgi:nicotinamidase-related amidase